MWPSAWPSAARAIATTLAASVTAARIRDESAFHEHTAELADLPTEQVTIVASAVIRELLEAAHPDGLAADDIRAVLTDVLRGAIPWLPTLDPTTVATALTGALGIDEHPDQPRTDPHPAAVLLIGHLADTTRIPIEDSIVRAISEVARAETVEMP
ncbi:hypothetical protein [Nocardia caishijiensis]|uniref:MftR C-terminal domain-containing protein n=1 Tax=Nocardia caishijiensis TaxID=184756 RepID=A0ABQ6YM25_9NOCA|nr:hypothetical protein [Nocardia caishijiensis]KAF0846839.1 hypothetical protein FNL39_104261 [Nocardia caishijiensis]